ncbi:gamma-glutamyl-gamma-aminobutyrate hydrolase family protein [Clostridium sp. YIM B02551]|uniref:gamma-glutamyl-gamma-aminobutyrate hydrolase family protein n=1 Tax=Clostridium sp. YIM B02551 TaxID=2910679 RepID=UPI001EEA3697|nr:gamma-glutamyl-gamma-aminobutyrate hydrolase family protein [Clostridium sp. YIM B02551]
MRKKKIGIVPNLTIICDGRVVGDEKIQVNADYANAISKVGAIPIILPVINDEDYIEEIISSLDGVVLSGGGDINPLYYGEEPKPLQGSISAARDEFDLRVIKNALNFNKGILGICRGIQAINVFFGGSLHQDISYGYKDYLKHSQVGDNDIATHTVDFIDGGNLVKLFGKSISTNSFHHQSINRLGKDLIATGFSKDGVIEAIEMQGNNKVFGVQWHPEKMRNNDDMTRMFKYFIDLV